MKNEQNLSRRNFLKKSAYVVPTIVTLGALETPAEAHGWGRMMGQGWGNSSCRQRKSGMGQGKGMNYQNGMGVGGTSIGHYKHK